MKILIIEDEEMVARRLERLIRRVLVGRKAEITHAADLSSARKVLATETPAVIFLDLNLEGEDGFELLAWATTGRFQTIIASANTDRAMEAFEFGVLDFVPKPFTEERVAKALARLNTNDRSSRAPARFVGVRTGSSVKLVRFDDLVLMTSVQGGSELLLSGELSYFHDKSLADFEAILPPKFVRSHRSTIVNTDFLDRIVSLRGSRYRMVLKDGRELPVGRTRIAALRLATGIN